MDLIFPHHENEIAQSEAAHPERGELAKIWLHNGFVNIDKEKMSKSLGNFVTVSDVLSRNDPEAFRWFLLSAHYRGPIQFDTETLAGGRVVFPGVDEAERRVDYLYGATQRLRELLAAGITAPAKLPPELLGYREQAQRAADAAEAGLDDDLNTPVALASLGELVRLGNELVDLAHKRKKDATFVGAATVAAHSVLSATEKLAKGLGLLQSTPRDYSERTRARRLRLRGLSAGEIDARVADRTQARNDKDYATSDAIRDELALQGIAVKDGPLGSEWSIEQ
jgi:cysteinyl-tRNA synthetase